MNKTLSDFERKAIDSIFNEAEQEHISSDQLMQNVFLLDQRSKEIWDDWDDAVTACMRGDISSQSIKYENNSHSTVIEKDDRNYYQPSKRSQKNHLNEINDSENTNAFRYATDVTNDSDIYHMPPTKNHSTVKNKSRETSAHHNAPRNSYGNEKDNSQLHQEKQIIKNVFKKSRKKKSSKGDTELSYTKNYSNREKITSNHPRKTTTVGRKANIDDCLSISSKSSVEPYNRGDAARLRQENLDLRNQIRRVQASLNRAIIEKERLLEEYEKSERMSAKQRNQINFFKGAK